MYRQAQQLDLLDTPETESTAAFPNNDTTLDRHTPLHPQAPKVLPTGEKDKKMFVPGQEGLYRRLSIRECARIQTFPDNYEFIYTHPRNGYKMVGNAVPVRLAYHLATQIKHYLG